MASVSLSPAGDRVAVSSHEGENWDVWIHDVARGTKSRLTFEDVEQWGPRWSPDGSRIVYMSGNKIELRAADGSGEPVELAEGRSASFSPDGKWIAYGSTGEDDVPKIWRLSLEGGAEPEVVVGGHAGAWLPSVSPDGRFLAYESDESGRDEAYLTRFPGGEGKWQVSVDGGNRPIWSRSGAEIYFRNEGTLMAVSVDLDSSPRLGSPEVLFDSRALGLDLWPGSYDADTTGSRFLTVKNLDQDESKDQIVVVTNWFSDFAGSH